MEQKRGQAAPPCPILEHAQNHYQINSKKALYQSAVTAIFAKNFP